LGGKDGEKMNLNFTKASLLKLKAPPKGRLYLHDTQERGLSAYITDQGVITFFVRKRINGKDQRIHLGHFPDLSIDNARKKALEVKADIAQGIDPNQGKSVFKEQKAFGQMFEEYMERYSKPFKKSWLSDERVVPSFFSHLFQRPASQISRTELIELHEKIGHRNGYIQANIAIKKVSAIYNKAIEWGWEGINPTTGIKKFKAKSRQRFLRKDEMPRFFKALAEESNPVVRDYILVSLLTGARKGNVLAMRWEDIHFSIQEWHIPETKNGEPHVIPLAASAMDILQERRENSQSPYVFPGNGNKGHFSNPKNGWKRVLDRAGISDLRIHDLRRTLGSWMAAMGATTAIIGKTLAHKDLKTTQIYERLDIEPVREFITRANEAIFQVACPENDAPRHEGQGAGQAAASATQTKTLKTLLRRNNGSLGG
jgi:integrase